MLKGFLNISSSLIKEADICIMRNQKDENLNDEILKEEEKGLQANMVQIYFLIS